MNVTINEPQEFVTRWINLAQPVVGAKPIFRTDEWFAPAERMLSPEPAVFIAGKFDDHGKWMDGWETRRRRGGGYDYCIIKLGLPGIIKGVDIDTSHFTCNYPPAASLDAYCAEAEPNDATQWTTVVPSVSLQGNTHHYVSVDDERTWTHVRLNIYPDGGVARLRVYGQVQCNWDKRDPNERVDLCAVENGGRPIAWNDSHFGPPHPLLTPGRGVNMGDGWETRRRREPGNDWMIIGHRGGAGRHLPLQGQLSGPLLDPGRALLGRHRALAHHAEHVLADPAAGAEARCGCHPHVQGAGTEGRTGEPRAAQHLPRRRGEPPAPLRPHRKVGGDENERRETQARTLDEAGFRTVWRRGRERRARLVLHQRQDGEALPRSLRSRHRRRGRAHRGEHLRGAAEHVSDAGAHGRAPCLVEPGVHPGRRQSVRRGGRAAGRDGAQEDLRAFLTNGRQGINYKRGTWHHVLLVPKRPMRFLVVDRAGPGTNCEEFWFDEADQFTLEI